jgi:hypothetical protein
VSQASVSEQGSDAVQRYQSLAQMIVGRTPSRPIGGEAEWAELVALAHCEGVAPLLACALRALPHMDVPAAAEAALTSAYTNAVCLSLLHQSVRARFCRRLGERSIPVILLKGAALAAMNYVDPATRPMQDLDVLIPPSRLEEAARCLEEDGFRPSPLGRSLVPVMNRPYVHLVYNHPATGAVVELHWDLHLPRRVRAQALREIWSQAQPVGSDGSAQVVRPGNMIPFLSAHMILQHRCAPLLWLHDLHRILLTASPEEIAQTPDVASRWRLGPATAHALLRVRELFGTPLPDSIAAWATAVAREPGLQARIAELALSPGNSEMPAGELLNLVMDGNWRFLRSFFPAPQVVREKFGLTTDQSVAPAYAALMARRLGQAPAQVRQFWRFWRGATRPQEPPPDTPCPSRGADR